MFVVMDDWDEQGRFSFLELLSPHSRLRFLVGLRSIGLRRRIHAVAAIAAVWSVSPLFGRFRGSLVGPF